MTECHFLSFSFSECHQSVADFLHSSVECGTGVPVAGGVWTVESLTSRGYIAEGGRSVIVGFHQALARFQFVSVYLFYFSFHFFMFFSLAL